MDRLRRSSYTVVTASPGEHLVYVAKLHWVACWWTKFIVLFGLVGCLWSPWFLVVVIPHAVWDVLFHYYSEIVLTDRRFIVRLGVLTNHVREMASNHLDEIIINQSVLGRIMDYGDITIHCKGMSEIRIRRIANPLALHKAIENAHIHNPSDEEPALV